MKTKLPLNPFCLAFGHNYFHSNNPINGKTSIICKSCNQQFRYSNNGNIIEVTSNQYSLFPKLRYLKL